MLTEMHIMLVDGDRSHLVALTRMLQALRVGFLTVAGSGRDAFAKWSASNKVVDCCIAACAMPEGNGLQLLQAVRTGVIRNVRPDSCVILTAETAAAPTVSAAVRLDVNGLLVKPISQERLAAAIEKGRKRIVKINFDLYKQVEVPL